MHGLINKEKAYIEIEVQPYLLSVLLAASGQNRCTSLVCSCYVPSRNFNTKGEESSRNNNNTKTGFLAEKKYGVMEEVLTTNNNESQELQVKNINGGSGNGPHIGIPTLKSNLKKHSTIVLEENQARTDHDQKRKVSWPDIAHGTDIAHVHEFEPSMSEDGSELEGVRNSCVCTIQ